MAILSTITTRIIVQGITGSEASLHVPRMIAAGAQVVGGITPGKGGQWLLGIPVFDTVEEATQATEANTSVVFVPAETAPDAIYEAINAQLELVVCITENIPMQEMLRIYAYLRGSGTRLIGPNCPGIMSPGLTSIGMIPSFVTMPGSTGIVARSGTLMYETAGALTRAGSGQSTLIGIGGDAIVGTTFVEVLEMFENDPDTTRVVLIGEIGGSGEIEAAQFIHTQMTKPVIALIAGSSAPGGKRMGHAGAIADQPEDSAQAKIKALRDAGVIIAQSPEEIPNLLY